LCSNDLARNLEVPAERFEVLYFKDGAPVGVLLC
jgi:hypothetical protein